MVAGEDRVFAQIDIAEPVLDEPQQATFYSSLNNEDFKTSTLQLVPGGDLQSRVLLINISPLARQGEVFYFLKQVTRSLRRITLFDDPNYQCLNSGVCLVDFDSFQAARGAIKKLNQLLMSEPPLKRVLGSQCKALVAEPYFDYFAALCRRTNIVLVKNLPAHPNIPQLYQIFARFGKVTRIRCYAHRAYIFFAESTHAQMLLTTVDEILIEGQLCKLRPARSHMRETILQRFIKPSAQLSSATLPVASNVSGPYSGTLLVPPSSSLLLQQSSATDNMNFADNNGQYWQQLSAAELSLDDQDNLIQYFCP